MKNTGIEYLSTERTPTVLPELAELLPPLTDEQLSSLEADILNNGCYSPVITNEDLVVIDGHNRMDICEEHGIPYRIAVFHFEDMLEAKQWALDTQKSRRNLDKWELGQIALKLKQDIEARAKANMSSGGGDKVSEDARAGSAISPNPPSDSIDTRKELAHAVGIGEKAMGQIIQIDENAPEAIKKALDNKEISVNKGYALTKELLDIPEDQRESAAMEVLEFEKAKTADKKANQKTDEQTKIAKQFCAAFEKASLIDPTEENVRIWIEFAAIREALLDDMIADARLLARSFTAIADILETKIKSGKRGDEDEQQTDDSDESSG